MKDDELIHYGKLGMRWGKRNTPQHSSASSKNQKKQVIDKKSKSFKRDYKEYRKAVSNVGYLQTTDYFGRTRAIKFIDPASKWANTMSKKKGKDYVDAIISKSDAHDAKVAVGALATLAAVSVGMSYLAHVSQ